MACVSILYKVGSRDEQSHKTGIAHLFEHLMFSNCGIDVNFDEIMQNAVKVMPLQHLTRLNIII